MTLLDERPPDGLYERIVAGVDWAEEATSPDERLVRVAQPVRRNLRRILPLGLAAAIAMAVWGWQLWSPDVSRPGAGGGVRRGKPNSRSLDASAAP